MFVGNHQLLALDSPFLVAEIWRRCRMPLRATVDDLFFWMPPLGRYVEQLGAVRASPRNADTLLAQGRWILVYPGGAREATKPDGRPYELCWWDRLGFAERALHHRCTIVPVGGACAPKWARPSSAGWKRWSDTMVAAPRRCAAPWARAPLTDRRAGETVDRARSGECGGVRAFRASLCTQ